MILMLHRRKMVKKQFQRCFWPFGAYGRVFMSYLRKFIRIDAIQLSGNLSGKYFGVLLIATTVDGNDNIIPIIFAIAKVECEPV